MRRGLGVVAGAALLLSFYRGSAMAQEVWPESQGSLSHKVVYVAEPHQLPKFTSNVSLPSMQRQVVFSGRSIRVGPFDMSYTGLVEPPGAGSSLQAVTFRVRVFGRSPQSLSSSADSRVIGQVTKTLKFGESANVFVDVDLPGGLNALAVELAVGGPAAGGGIFWNPIEVFPSGNCLPPVNDDSLCFQAGINPAAVISGIVPLAILYEPPGNCSYSSFSATGLQGAGFSIDTSDSTATQTLRDVTFAGGLVTDTHSNTNVTHAQTDSKESIVQLKSGVTYFTQLGPIGDVRCSQVDQQANVPDRRSSGGPGRGDVFVLLVNAPFVYWNTGNLSNARYLLPNEPLPPGLEVVQTNPTAENLRTRTNLATVLMMRPQSDLDAIRNVDPLTTNIPSDPNAPVTTTAFHELPSNRYLRVTAPFSLGTNSAPMKVDQEHDDSRFSVATVTQQYTDIMKDSSKDLVVALLNKAAQFGTKYLAGKAAGVATNYLFLSGNGSPKDISKVEDAVSSQSIPTLFEDSTTITTQTTLLDAQSQKQFSTFGNVQSFFIKDTLRPLDFQVYYDVIFGTFAFQEKPSAMGQVTQDVRSGLESQGRTFPQFAWVKSITRGAGIEAAIPATISNQIAALGGDGRFAQFVLEPLSSGEMIARAGATRGVPFGLDVSAAGISGATNATAGVYQQAYYVVGAQPADDSITPILWMTISLIEPTPFESSNCTRVTNTDTAAPGTDIVTCCSPGQLCDIFVAPSTACTGGDSVTFYQSFESGSTVDIFGGPKTPQQGPVSIVVAPGLFGKGIDGSTDSNISYWDPIGTSLSFSKPGSLSFWFKNGSNVGAEPFAFVAFDFYAHIKFVMTGGPAALSAYFEFADATNGGAATSGAAFSSSGMSDLAIGQWHLVVVNWAFDTMAISVDGGPQTVNVIKWLAGNHAFGPDVGSLIYVAGSLTSPNSFYPGSGDEVIVMNRPMTDGEIQWYWAQRFSGGPDVLNSAVDHFNATSNACVQ